MHWRIVEEESGNLVIRFGSHDVELLEGVKLVLKAGTVQKMVELERVTEDQVGAEVIFTREERTDQLKMPEDVQLTFDILNED